MPMKRAKESLFDHRKIILWYLSLFTWKFVSEQGVKD